jgi:hypothetical protein
MTMREDLIQVFKDMNIVTAFIIVMLLPMAIGYIIVTAIQKLFGLFTR